MKFAQSKAPKRQADHPSTQLVLTLDLMTYIIVPLANDAGSGRRAFRLIKSDGKVYDLSETRYGPECDCPDFIFRRDGLDPSGCKHIKAMVRHGLIAPRHPRLAERGSISTR